MGCNNKKRLFRRGAARREKREFCRYGTKKSRRYRLTAPRWLVGWLVGWLVKDYAIHRFRQSLSSGDFPHIKAEIPAAGNGYVSGLCA